MGIRELGSKFGSFLLLITWPALASGFIAVLLAVGAICYWLLVVIIIQAAKIIQLVIDNSPFLV
jgi:hypothetical protein